MRICYPFVGDSIGGAQISVITLIRNLPPGFEPVLVLHEAGALSRFLESEGLPFSLLRLPDYAGRHPSPVSQLHALWSVTPVLHRFISDQAIDIVHTQDGRMHASWWLAARREGIPHIWHQRSPYSGSRLLNFMIRRTPAVIAISETARTTLPEPVGKQAHVIFNPVAPPARRPDGRKFRRDILTKARAAGIDVTQDTAIIATAGNLREVKQPLLLAEAVTRSAMVHGRRLLLAVFGEDRGNWFDRMRAAMSTFGNSCSLVDMGFQHPLADWLSGCDILAATSRGDAFGRTLVEAMSVGVPVIATDVGGHREIVEHGDNGFLVPHDDADALANSITTLIQDAELRKRICVAGVKRATDFRPERHVSLILDVYRHVCPTDG